MEFITTIHEMRNFSKKVRNSGRSIGFVPTMGYLHQGHLSLVEGARAECDVTVVSIFVNPAQFCPGEDLEAYPRDIKGDKSLLEKKGVDVLFSPEISEIFPAGYSTYVEVGSEFTNKLCGASRPGHFKGVTTILSKFFNIIQPDVSYFGQKDAQQAVVVGRMVCDMNFHVKIQVMPTVRELDGLAMSSRNGYLSEDQRKSASSIYRGLQAALEEVNKGVRDAQKIKTQVENVIAEHKDVRIDYLEIVDGGQLRKLDEIKNGALLCVAAFVGDTRLIDNVVLSFPDGGE